MAPRKKNAAAPVNVVIPSDNDVVEVPPPKRSMRNRKKVTYTERNENDSDIAEEAPKKRAKAATKSKVSSAAQDVETAGDGQVNRKGKKKAASEVVVVDEEVEEEQPKPKPKPKKKSRARDDEIEYDGEGEEIRKREYQDEPSDKFLGNKDRALTQPLMFVARERCDNLVAPRETFTIAGNSGKDYTVEVRHVPKCSCMDFAIRRVPCKHLIYTMVQVLKVSIDSPILYQQALTSIELQAIFNHAPAAPHIEIKEDEFDPNRKPVEGECPICYMEFEPGKESITYCKAHCGNNVHRVCMDTWLRSQRNMYGKGTCPYCRQQWVS